MYKKHTHKKKTLYRCTLESILTDCITAWYVNCSASDLIWQGASCFHFTITALTVGRGSSSKVEIWRTDLLERWHPMTVPRWKSLSSSVRAILLQNVCLWRLHGCVLYFIHLSATNVAEIAESTILKGCPHTFGHVVYIHSLKHKNVFKVLQCLDCLLSSYPGCWKRVLCCPLDFTSRKKHHLKDPHSQSRSVVIQPGI